LDQPAASRQAVFGAFVFARQIRTYARHFRRFLASPAGHLGNGQVVIPKGSRRVLNGLRTLVFLGATLGPAWTSELSAQPPTQLDETQVKAAFLYNLAKFVKWPSQTFSSPRDPLTMCVLGSTGLAPVLENTIAGKEIEGRRLVVRTISDLHQIAMCQILFVSGSEEPRVPSILAGCKTRGVLTVGEREGFAAQGGVISFRVENDKVRFEINPGAASDQGLQISAKVLSLARIVKSRL
jgi:hypothetical protein